MTEAFDPAKDAAARAAAEFVEPGMRLGFGSGTTLWCFLDHLAARVRAGLEVAGVPASEATAQRARNLGIPLLRLDQVERLDLTIDGADEIDPRKDMIKGGGAALVREKIVAAAATEMVVMVGENKLVEVLGRSFRLPVEVLEFGWRQAARRIETLGCSTELRCGSDGEALRTDNGNRILDCAFDDGIHAPRELERELNAIPGVLDNGLFVGMAGRVLVGSPAGTVREIS
ncbi:MAG: ribose-5-phosphate isomerase RpiA [Planctomycetes bacterium]|nr:ribose-5-phosphate isomerase RpiA [Planctomycetota bacterium]MCB9888103.1 ribose-5-phosphate isomerase RpiA [Planctomycetota bacterium]